MEIGGGFGGKALALFEPIVVALAQKTGRPVKLVLSREEVLRATGPGAPAAGMNALRRSGVQVVATESPDRSAAIEEALTALGGREVQSLLVEGGAGLAAALLAAGAVDRVAWFVAPVVIGGTAAPGAVGDPGAAALAGAPRLRDVAVARVGEDVLVTGRLRPVPEG